MGDTLVQKNQFGATRLKSQIEIYPVQNWSLEMPQEPSSRSEPQCWIKFLDPWVQDFCKLGFRGPKWRKIGLKCAKSVPHPQNWRLSRRGEDHHLVDKRFFRNVRDTSKFLRHVMRAILSVRPKCSHRCVSPKEFPFKSCANPPARHQNINRANLYENDMV